MKSLFILAAGPLQLPVIVAAKRLGLRVVVADGDQNAPGLRLADAAHIIDITNPQACLAVAKSECVDGIIHICSEVAMASLGLVNEVLFLHGPNCETVVRATNKEQMRRAFERGGAPSPRSIGVYTADEAISAVSTIGGPTIFKPSRNSGSRGISFLPADCSPTQIRAVFQRAFIESRDHSVVVEQFVEGPEFSVEALIWNKHVEIVAITEKNTTGRPSFVEMGHNEPARINEADAMLVRTATIKGIHALDLDWCAAHAEVKLSATGPFLMEIGARLGGDFITTELVPRSTGIDMVSAAIRLSLGEVPDLKPAHASQAAAIRYLAPKPGRVILVKGVDSARQFPGVMLVEIYVSQGDQIREIDSSLARAGHVIAEGRTADEAVTNAQRAADHICILTSI